MRYIAIDRRQNPRPEKTKDKPLTRQHDGSGRSAEEVESPEKKQDYRSDKGKRCKVPAHRPIRLRFQSRDAFFGRA